MKKLSIPTHISLEKNYLPGIGQRELRRLLTAVLPSLVLIVILWIALPQPGTKILALLLWMGYVVSCYGLLAKIDGRQSMFDYISNVLQFHKTQQKYYYTHGEEVIRIVEKDH